VNSLVQNIPAQLNGCVCGKNTITQQEVLGRTSRLLSFDITDMTNKEKSNHINLFLFYSFIYSFK
jgi:hypothetical protein